MITLVRISFISVKTMSPARCVSSYWWISGLSWISTAICANDCSRRLTISSNFWMCWSSKWRMASTSPCSARVTSNTTNKSSIWRDMFYKSINRYWTLIECSAWWRCWRSRSMNSFGSGIGTSIASNRSLTNGYLNFNGPVRMNLFHASINETINQSISDKMRLNADDTVHTKASEPECCKICFRIFFCTVRSYRPVQLAFIMTYVQSW